MSARRPRFEVVRGDDGWFGRYIAANGREVWRTSQVYKRHHSAQDAILCLDAEITDGLSGWREVDERTAP